MKKVYLDTEFTGLRQDTTLISLGMVAEHGETFYAEFNDYDVSQVDSWIKENVIDKLLFNKPGYEQPGFFSWDKKSNVKLRSNSASIASYIFDWFQEICHDNNHRTPIIEIPEIEIYSDTLAYDWVLFCNLWKHALNLPKIIYYIPQDLSSYLRYKNIDPDINREEFAELKISNKHNSLSDAIVIKSCFEKIFKL